MADAVYRINGRRVTRKQFLKDCRGIAPGRGTAVHADYKREKTSLGLGVPVDDIDRVEADAARHGVDVKFERHGECAGEAIITGTRQFEKLARFMGQEIK